MPSPISCSPRLRNAAATREAMLVSARRHFARESYENVGLRDIARDAGVDPALVSRYFGGKAQLFKEALRGHARPVIDDISHADMPAHLASLLIDGMGMDDEYRAAKVDCLMMMLRSSGSPQANAIVREAISEDMLHPLAKLVGGEDGDVCASLALAVLMGSGILRSAMGIDPLCASKDERVRERLRALFAVALDVPA